MWRAHGQKMANAIVEGAAQDGQAVIDGQRAWRIEAEIFLQSKPELLVFLGETIVVGTDQPIEERRELDSLKFE